MSRLGGVFWFVLVIASGMTNFIVKQYVQGLDEQLSAVKKKTVAEQKAIHELTADWTFLNQPELLAGLNNRYVHLSPVAPKQVIAGADALPLRPTPPAPPPGPEPAPQLAMALDPPPPPPVLAAPPPPVSAMTFVPSPQPVVPAAAPVPVSAPASVVAAPRPAPAPVHATPLAVIAAAHAETAPAPAPPRQPAPAPKPAASLDGLFAQVSGDR